MTKPNDITAQPEDLQAAGVVKPKEEDTEASKAPETAKAPKQDFVKLQELDTMTIEKLRETAKALKIDTVGKNRSVLKADITKAYSSINGYFEDSGFLEITKDKDGNIRGFLRHNYAKDQTDTYVSASQIKLFGLSDGDVVSGVVRPPKDNERHQSLLKIESVNRRDPVKVKNFRKPFEELTAIYPDERYRMELREPSANVINSVSLQVIDLFAPIGKGQRGLIVAPPKTGKTTLLKDMANSFAANYPESIMIILLIDERPEEVTDIKRSVKNKKHPENVYVIASTFDEAPENHMRIAEQVLNTSKRFTECGYDVIVLLDSITRLTRSSNVTVTPSGRTLSGGIDPAAFYRPKKFIGAARNIEEGGSLTIIATALIDTGSKMDDAIFEEFKATGNMELVLDRALTEKRIFPAVDIMKSGTRHDELLYTREESDIRLKLPEIAKICQGNINELMINSLRNSFKNNEDFIKNFDKHARAFRSIGNKDIND